MVQGRCREAWDHTASLLAAAENQFKSEGDALTQPRDRHPFYRTEQGGEPPRAERDKIHVKKGEWQVHVRPALGL
jgi:hypothetical protein